MQKRHCIKNAGGAYVRGGIYLQGTTVFEGGIYFFGKPETLIAG